MTHTIGSLIAMLPKTLPGDKAKRADTIIQLNVVIKDEKVNVAKGTHAAPELTVTADSADILAAADSKLDLPRSSCRARPKSQVI